MSRSTASRRGRRPRCAALVAGPRPCRASTPAWPRTGNQRRGAARRPAAGGAADDGRAAGPAWGDGVRSVVE
eukprot:gene15884-biopygen5865